MPARIVEKCAEMIAMRRRGLTYGQIAQRFKCSKQNVQAVIMRATGFDDPKEKEIERLRRALRNITTGEYPVTVGKHYRTDGKPSKHDQCVHDRYMYESCECCINDYVISVLGGE